MWRRRIGVPAVIVDAAVGDHFEVLGLALRWRVRIGLVEGVGHADAFDRLLLDAIDRLRRLDTGGFEDRRHDIDDVVKLVAHAARIVDVTGPRDRHALSCAAEVRRDLLGELERRVERPRPCHRHVRVTVRRSPGIVEFKLLFWEADISTTGELRSRILTEIYALLGEEGIQLPSGGQTNVYLHFPEGVPISDARSAKSGEKDEKEAK